MCLPLWRGGKLLEQCTHPRLADRRPRITVSEQCGGVVEKSGR